MEYSDLILLLIAGCVGGLLSGMLGVGGGVIFVPIITFIVQKLNVSSGDFTGIVMANSFLVIMAIGISGTLKQKKLGTFYPALILAAGVPSIITSLLTSKFFVASGLYSKELFTLIFTTLMVFILYRFIREALIVKKKEALVEEINEEIFQTKKFILPGSIAGVIAALSGLGGGIILIPYFTQLLKIPIRFATGLSLSVITVSAFPLVILYLLKDPSAISDSYSHTGFIIWNLALPLMLGALLTVRVGVLLSRKVPPYLTYLLLSIFIIITIVKMLLDL